MKNESRKLVPLIFLLFIPIAFASEQNLVYDDADNTVKIGYDGLNRIVHKNSSSEIINYTYDKQLQGTLNNITFGNSTYKYIYDDKMRVTEEKRIIDGIEFTKTYVYDSNDRLISELFNGQDLDYYYSQDGKVNKITGYINNTQYNPFGNPLQRTYFNAKSTEFSYYSDNARLRQIKTGTIQSINYTYDNVGNILSINDSVNNRTYSMSYDNLDRLTNVSIGAFKWVYSYDAIGNILKIARNHSVTTSFKFDGSLAHAPQKVLTHNTSIDIYRETILNNSNKSKQVQFYLVNEKNETINANWTVNFGDGNLINSSSSSLDKSAFIFITANNTYITGGNYKVNITGLYNKSNSDYEIINLLFGSAAKDISILKKNATLVVSEFSVKNLDNNYSTSWGWNCSNGVFSTLDFNMSANEEAFVVMEHNYSLSSLSHNLTCKVNSSDGNQSITQPFSFDKVLIENYNSSLKGASGIEVQFQIKNYFDTLTNIEWNITAAGQVIKSAAPLTLNQGQTTTITQEINFTTRGVKPLKITIYSGNFTDTYSEDIRLYSLDILNFLNIAKNGTTRIFNFLIQNTWLNLTAYWNVSDPVVQNATILNQNESLIVVIEENYPQGKKEVEIRLYNQTVLEDKITEIFTIKHIGINEFETLFQNSSNAVTSALVVNNINPINVSWRLNNTQELIVSTQSLELNTSQQAIIVVQSNFSTSGIYPLNFIINSSNKNDNETGVAISWNPRYTLDF